LFYLFFEFAVFENPEPRHISLKLGTDGGYQLQPPPFQHIENKAGLGVTRRERQNGEGHLLGCHDQVNLHLTGHDSHTKYCVLCVLTHNKYSSIFLWRLSDPQEDDRATI